jgi:hypothetical protein
MKRIITLIILGFLALPMAMNAQDYNSEQLALRSDLFGFLREEGFVPEYDSDGDIRFKSEGKTYYISVADANENPMFVTMFRIFSKPEGYSMETLVMATKELNLYKGAKVICFEDSYRIQAELFVRSAEPVKAVFYKMKEIIDSIKDDVLDECAAVGSSAGSSYSSVSEVPFLVTKMDVGNTDANNNIIQDYGASIWDYKTQYLRPRITIKPFVKSGTYTVYVKLYKNGTLSTGSNSPAGYSYSNTITVSGGASQVFYLSGWGSSTPGNWSIGDYRFEVWYGNYCIGSKSFKVI